MASTTKKIRITRAIILAGEHAEEGSIHEVSRALAQSLIGSDCAVEHCEEGEEPEASPTSVNRMEAPVERDPHTKQIAPAPPKVKAAK